jgi:hypothetical protein
MGPRELLAAVGEPVENGEARRRVPFCTAMLWRRRPRVGKQLRVVDVSTLLVESVER